jgi:hypothetical protein
VIHDNNPTDSFRSSSFEKSPFPITNRRVILAVALLFVLTFGIFQYTVEIRKPWLGSLYSPIHINLTAHSTLFAKIWYREGPIRLQFASVQIPRSIENQTHNRLLYVSWPPGYILPLYLVGIITGHEPSIASVQKYNLFGHFLLAYLLSLSVFFVLLRMDYGYFIALALSLIPIIIVLLTPGNLWFLQMIYMAQQAAIPLFALFVFLEVLRDFKWNKFWAAFIAITQSIVFFYGILTAYIFLLIGLVVFFKRILTKEIRLGVLPFIKDSVKFWAPAVTGAALFVLQLSVLKGWPHLISRWKYRAGASGGMDFWLSRFWNVYFKGSYGIAGKYLIWVSTLFFLGALALVIIKRLRKYPSDGRILRILFLMGITLIPCYLQIYLLKNHTWSHHYTAVKFTIPLAVVPFILVPMLIGRHITPLPEKWSASVGRILKIPAHSVKKYAGAIAVIILILSSLIYALSIHKNYTRFFNNESTLKIHNRHIQPYSLVGDNTRFEDIVFSNRLEVTQVNKAAMIYSMKTVHKIFSLYDIFSMVCWFHQDYTVNLLVNSRDDLPLYLKNLIEKADDWKRSGDWRLYKLNKETFLSYYRTVGNEDERKAYMRQRNEYNQALKSLRSYLQMNRVEQALEQLDIILFFFEKHEAVKYHHPFYRFKAALLTKLKRDSESADLLQWIEGIPEVVRNETIWGWNPYAWMGIRY